MSVWNCSSTVGNLLQWIERTLTFVRTWWYSRGFIIAILSLQWLSKLELNFLIVQVGKPRLSKVKSLLKVTELVSGIGRLQTNSVCSESCVLPIVSQSTKQALVSGVKHWFLATGSWLIIWYNVYESPLSLAGFSGGLLPNYSSSKEFNTSIICGLLETSIWFHIPISRNRNRTFPG